MHDYQTGFLVHSPAGAAYRIRYLLRYADKRQRMGATGHDFVRENFLLTRHLRDYFSMLLWLDNPGHRRAGGLRSAAQADARTTTGKSANSSPNAAAPLSWRAHAGQHVDERACEIGR